MKKYTVDVRVAGWKTYLFEVPDGVDLYDYIYEQLDSGLYDPIVDDTYDEMVSDPKEYNK